MCSQEKATFLKCSFQTNITVYEIIVNVIKSLEYFLLYYGICKNIFNPCHLKQQQKYFYIFLFQGLNINVMEFNVFHCLLYSNHMNTSVRECGRPWRECAVVFVEEEVFHRYPSLPSGWRRDISVNRERFHVVYATGDQIYCVSTAASPVQTQKSHQHNKTTCAANSVHLWGILNKKKEFVYSLFFSKLHGCLCTLLKPLHSGRDVFFCLECSSILCYQYVALYDGKVEQ